MISARGFVGLAGVAVALLAGCSAETDGVATPALPGSAADETAPSTSEDTSRGRVLDAQAVESAVSEQYADQYGTSLSDLDCTEDMVVTVGATYECDGTEDGDGDVTITIEITDDDGSYTWTATD